MLLTLLAVALPFAFVSLLLLILPNLSRRTQFFAVTVGPQFRESGEAQRIVRRYRTQVAIHSIIGAAGLVLAVTLNSTAWLLPALVWPSVGSLIAVVLAHRESLAYAVSASNIRQASLRPRPGRRAGNLLLWSGPFLLMAAAGVSIGSRWSEIPARFPIHWDLNNTPNGWAARSVSGVYTPLAIGLFVCLLMQFLNFQITRNSRGSTAMRQLTSNLLLVLSYFIALLFGWLTVALPLGHGTPSPLNLGILMGSLAIFIVAIVVYGLRAKTEPEPDLEPAAAHGMFSLLDNTADRHWVGGLFYFNPDDPATFVEKRIGIGYDLNFGNPRSWVFLGLIAMIPLAAVLVSKL